MKHHLRHILKGKIVIIGIGQTLRGDDGFGPALIERLKGRVKAVCLDAGTSPESYSGKIAKEAPDTILLVDAVHLGLKAGACEILEKSDILESGFTTHDISPRMFIAYLKRQTKAAIYMLGVQPQNLTLGERISDAVKKTLDHVEQDLKEIIGA